MGRFHGMVGFRIFKDNQETGQVESTVVERPYYGRVIEHSRRWETTDMATDDLKLGNQIAVTANDFAYRHASAITHILFMGQRWKVTAVRVKTPQLILTLGGVYNGPNPTGSAGCPSNAGA